MSNDSSTGGFLVPAASPAPLEGQSFDDFLQQAIAGITGLPGTSVRPRWQSDVPNLPAYGTDWLAFGVMRHTPDTYAYVEHDPTGDGADNLQRHEEVELLCSFYGPNASMYAQVLSDGLQIAQNREVLQQNNMGLVNTGEIITVPSLIKERWTMRVDMSIVIRRQILRTYPILNLLHADGTLHAIVMDRTINV